MERKFLIINVFSLWCLGQIEQAVMSCPTKVANSCTKHAVPPPEDTAVDASLHVFGPEHDISKVAA